MINNNYKNQIENIISLINDKNFKKSILLIEDLINKFPNDFFLENFYLGFYQSSKILPKKF